MALYHSIVFFPGIHFVVIEISEGCVLQFHLFSTLSELKIYRQAGVDKNVRVLLVCGGKLLLYLLLVLASCVDSSGTLKGRPPSKLITCSGKNILIYCIKHGKDVGSTCHGPLIECYLHFR